MFSQDRFELRETDVERIGTDIAVPQKFIDIPAQLDLAKLALIIECQQAVIGETKNDSRCFRRLFVVREVLKRAGHAEMQS